MKIDCLIAQDKMKSRFYKIKCTTASDQVLNCQSEIDILNNLGHSVTSMLIL
jgi:ribosomal protein S27E